MIVERRDLSSNAWQERSAGDWREPTTLGCLSEGNLKVIVGDRISRSRLYLMPTLELSYPSVTQSIKMLIRCFLWLVV